MKILAKLGIYARYPRTILRFSEDIGKLIFGANRRSFDDDREDLCSDEMTINFCMLCPRVENQIGGEVQS